MSKKERIFISDTIEREKTEDFILRANPNLWPLFPLFPVKRKNEILAGDDYELGVILAFGNRLTVYLGNIFESGIKKGVFFPEISLKMLKVKKMCDFFNLSKKEYSTVKELLDDGWRGN